MKGYMYILKCANHKYYVGSTTNLKRRLWQHEHGEGAQYTKSQLRLVSCVEPPFELVYTEEFDRIDAAFEREQQIKKWSHAKKDALVHGSIDKLHQLSECQNDTKFGS